MHMARVILLLLAFVLALPGIPLVHSGSTDSGHASTDAHDTTIMVLCHTTAGDPRQAASGEHVHQCGAATAILSNANVATAVLDHGPHRLGRVGPYTSPAFDPPERPPNRLT